MDAPGSPVAPTARPGRGRRRLHRRRPGDGAARARHRRARTDRARTQRLRDRLGAGGEPRRGAGLRSRRDGERLARALCRARPRHPFHQRLHHPGAQARLRAQHGAAGRPARAAPVLHHPRDGFRGHVRGAARGRLRLDAGPRDHRGRAAREQRARAGPRARRRERHECRQHRATGFSLHPGHSYDDALHRRGHIPVDSAIFALPCWRGVLGEA